MTIITRALIIIISIIIINYNFYHDNSVPTARVEVDEMTEWNTTALKAMDTKNYNTQYTQMNNYNSYLTELNTIRVVTNELDLMASSVKWA